MYLYTNGIFSSYESGSIPYSDDYSFVFDGVSDYINVPDNDSLSFGDSSTDSPFSISAWVKCNSGDIVQIANKFSASNNIEYHLVKTSADQILFRIFDSDELVRRGRLTSTLTTELNGWFHVCVTYNGVGGTNADLGIKIYVNGTQIDNASANKNTYTAMHNTNADFRAGNYSTSYSVGKVDELAVFDSELSGGFAGSDIETIYNGGVPNDLNSFNPVSWWREENATFDGSNWTITDSGSGGNDGTSSGMDINSRSTDVPPNFNLKSIELDGISDYVDCGDNDNLSFGNGTTDSPFSISTWVKLGSTSTMGIVSKYGASSSEREWLFYTNAGKPRILLIDKSNSTNAFAEGNTALSTNTFYHITCTYDGRGGSTAYQGLNIYVDGVLQSLTTSGTSYTAMHNTSQPVEIGKYQASNFNGNIDEVSIFNSELSQSDVSTIYNSGVPNDISSLSPLSWWRCGDNDTAPTLTDNGSGSNDGTMNSFSTFSTDVP